MKTRIGDVELAHMDAIGTENFPILYENGQVRVFKNPCDELFIENTESGVTMRLSPSRGGLEFTAPNGSVEPVVSQGLLQWRVSPRQANP